MADEINFTATLTVSKNGFTIQGSRTDSLDMSGTEMLSSVQTFTATTAAVNVGGCDSIGAIFIRNSDSTNNLIIGLDNADPITQIVSTIPPGGAILLHRPPATLYAETSTGSIEAHVVVCEQ